MGVTTGVTGGLTTSVTTGVTGGRVTGGITGGRRSRRIDDQHPETTTSTTSGVLWRPSLVTTASWKRWVPIARPASTVTTVLGGLDGAALDEGGHRIGSRRALRAGPCRSWGHHLPPPASKDLLPSRLKLAPKPTLRGR